MTDTQVYIQGAHDNDEGERPYGENTWAVVDENEGGIVAYAGSIELAQLIMRAIRAKYADTPLMPGDRVMYVGTYAPYAGTIGVVDQRDIGTGYVGVTWAEDDRSGERVSDLKRIY